MNTLYRAGLLIAILSGPVCLVLWAGYVSLHTPTLTQMSAYVSSIDEGRVLRGVPRNGRYVVSGIKVRSCPAQTQVVIQDRHMELHTFASLESGIVPVGPYTVSYDFTVPDNVALGPAQIWRYVSYECPLFSETIHTPAAAFEVIE